MTSYTRPRPVLGRRAFLQALGIGASAVALGPVLSACGGSGGAAAASGPAVPLPTYTPASKLTPDLVGNADGLQDGYLKGLADRFVSVEGKPATSPTLRAMVATYQAPPPPVGDNTWWKAVNERVGTDIQMDIVPAADFSAKFGSVMAGNDLPDVVGIPIYLNLPRLPDLYRNRFADLSDYLSGDNIKNYPNLAGIPSYAWRNSSVNGRIYSVPITRSVFGSPFYIRTDLVSSMGVNTAPKSSADFEALCKDLTNAQAGRWALTAPATYAIDNFVQMFGGPKFWREEGGKLTRDYETPEYQEAIAFAAKLVAAGYFHPDSGSATSAQVKQYFTGGKALMCADAASAWQGYYEQYSKAVPGLKLDALPPIAADGGTPIFFFDTGAFSVNAIKQGSPERVQEILRIINYFSAPYGSQEDLLNTYGVEGVDHTRNADNTLKYTDRGTTERTVNFNYLGVGAPVLVSGQYPDWVRAQYEWEKQVVPLGVRDPVLGLYSETSSRVFSKLDKAMRDAIYGIIAGRNPMSSYATALAAWKSGGGDAMREEYQQALQAAGS